MNEIAPAQNAFRYWSWWLVFCYLFSS